MKEYKRIVGYVRKSRAEHGKTEEELLQEQISFIDNKSYEMSQHIEIKQEVGSGESIENRKVFKSVLDLLKSGHYDALCCRDITRLTRGNYNDMSEIYDLIEKYDIDIITQDFVFSTDNNSSMFMLRQRLGYSKEEIEMIKLRLQSGKKNAASLGKWMVTAAIPFGYWYDKNNKEQKLLIDEDQVPLVQMMYKMIGEEGTTIHAIKLKLKKMGVKSPRGKDEWGHSTLKKILQNEAYLGTVIYNRSKWFKGENIKGVIVNKKVPRKDSEIIRVLNAHPPIITQELFDKVQDRLNDRVLTSTVPSVFELSELAYLVKCPGKYNIGCGRNLSKKSYSATYTKKDGSKSTYPKDYLYCKDCERSLRYYDILDMLVDELKKLTIDEKRLKKYYDGLELFKEDKHSEITFLESRLESENKNLENQRYLFLKSSNNDRRRYPEHIYEADQDRTIAAIDNITEELFNLKRQEKIEFKDVKKDVMGKLKTFYDAYESVPNSEYRNEVLRLVFDYVEVEVLQEPKARQPALYDISAYLQKGLFI